MEYSLSSSLVGGSGSLNPDGLSLDLQFAADKTLTARKGPTPVFTRSSGDTGGVTYFAPCRISYLSVDTFQSSSMNNGRYSWVSVDGVITISYNGVSWELASDGNIIATSAPTTAYRPDLANWSASGVNVSATSTFGIVRAVNNEPRFDYDPITLASRGLLIEEQRVNQIKFSYNNFKNIYWNSTANNVLAVDTVATGPDGISASSSSLAERVGTLVTRHIHETTGVFTPAANTAYTMSAWVKQPPSDPIRYVQLAFWIAGFGSTSYMNYDIQTGTVGTGGAGITASSITAYPDGWYRITATATSVASPAASGFQLGFSTSSSAVRTEAYTAASPFKSIYLWGAQVEQGSFATSYIPTVSSSLTRSADVCSITGSDFTSFAKQGQGSVIVHGDSYQGTTPAFCQFTDNVNASTSFVFVRNNSTGALIFTDSSSGSVNVSTSPSYPVKFGAVRGQVLGVRTYYNGSIVAASNFTTNGVQTKMLIGNSSSGLPLNGCIRSIKHYKQVLSQTKMQSLTT